MAVGEKFAKLYKERKWYDCTEYIKELAKVQAIGAQDAGEMGKALTDVMKRMHPRTSASTLTLLASFMETGAAVELLNTAASVILGQMDDDPRYTSELIDVQSRLCYYRIKQGELDERESEILGWLAVYDTDESNTSTVPYSQENHLFLHFLAYSFYTAIGNAELAQFYLLAYVEKSGDHSVLLPLVQLSVISESFFNFHAVSSLEGFNQLQDPALKKLFFSFQSGDIKQVRSGKKQITQILQAIKGERPSDETVAKIIEKVYLVNILKICFSSPQKFVPFETFMTEMHLDDCNYLIALLLQSLGNGLVSGYIDSETQRLYFDRLIPRTLSDEDLAEMKGNFSAWRKRVSQAYRQIEASK
ncbi:26S proteasome regulatory subunit N9 [Pancytospora philotis]|nr:26S proteasome regulatory subunit N9 [Pancytospora philotis]